VGDDSFHKPTGSTAAPDRLSGVAVYWRLAHFRSALFRFCLLGTSFYGRLPFRSASRQAPCLGWWFRSLTVHTGLSPATAITCLEYREGGLLPRDRLFIFTDCWLTFFRRLILVIYRRCATLPVLVAREVSPCSYIQQA